MVALNKTLIYYPEVKHPLQKENDFVKQQYIAIIRKIASRFEADKNLVDYKLKSLFFVLFNYEKKDNHWKHCSKRGYIEVFKTRFKYNKFFSYCTFLLFDSVFLFAADNKINGTKIKKTISNYSEKRYLKLLDVIINELYEDVDRFLIYKILPDDLIQAWFSANKFINSEIKQFVFTATMSAGKSTLINAIIGENLSTVKKAACTSTILKFNSLPTKSKFFTIEGKQQIFFQDSKFVGSNVNGRKQPYEISGYFSSVLCQKRILLIDTPGINSSRFPVHESLTRDALLSIRHKTIIYVIPVETYGSKDDYDHLVFIKEQVNYDKIIFLINMIDTCDLEDDSIDEIIEDVRMHLVKIGFVTPLVYPISAKAGFQLKRLINGSSLTENARKSCNTYINLFSRKEFSLKNYYPIEEKEVYDSVRLTAKLKDKRVLTAFINTGVPELEKLLFNI